jgi:hypothetical protein
MSWGGGIGGLFRSFLRQIGPEDGSELDLIVVKEKRRERRKNREMRIDVVGCMKEDPCEWGIGSLS